MIKKKKMYFFIHNVVCRNVFYAIIMHAIRRTEKIWKCKSELFIYYTMYSYDRICENNVYFMRIHYNAMSRILNS